MKHICILSLFLFSHFAAANSKSVEVVTQFINAFNSKNLGVMLQLTNQDVHWMSVSGQQLSVETNSQSALEKAMTEYFESIPSARSDLVSISYSGPFVHTVEQAFWISGGLEKSQCSMAIYQLDNSKISQVWYFPSYQCNG